MASELLTRAVAQGQCVASICAVSKTPTAKVWDHPSNAALKQLRVSPNVLFPGDVVNVPREPGTLELKPNQLNRFRVTGQTVQLRLTLRDALQLPMQQVEYELTVGGRVIRDKTNDQGELEQVIPAKLECATLLVTGSSEPIELLLGALDPLKELSGVQARLENLGYPPGPIDGLMGPLTHGAIRKFRQAMGLPEGDEVDDELRAKLKELHGL